MLSNPEYDHGDFAVLYRTNAQSRALEDRFRRRGVPYQIVGGVRFYERREIQDVLAYLRLIANARDMDAFDRVVNYPRRGWGAPRWSGWPRMPVPRGSISSGRRSGRIWSGTDRAGPPGTNGLRRAGSQVRGT